jgi:hypothetical protein
MFMKLHAKILQGMEMRTKEIVELHIVNEILNDSFCHQFVWDLTLVSSPFICNSQMNLTQSGGPAVKY